MEIIGKYLKEIGNTKTKIKQHKELYFTKTWKK